MPADVCLWTNEAKGVAPVRPTAGKPGPEDTGRWRKSRTLGTISEGRLLAEGEVLEREVSARPQGGDERAQQNAQEGTHGRGNVTPR